MVSYGSGLAPSIPENYDRHFGPVLFEPYAVDMAARIPAGARVLEVACGTGRVTRHLAARASAVVASDFSEAMLGRAKQVIDSPRVTWRVADAQALPFGDGEFDAVVCQFGLMFVPDKVLALREMKRVGGKLFLSVWDKLEANPASKLLHELAMSTFPDDPPNFMAAPFSLGDPDELRRLATAAGFTNIEVETVAKIGESISADDFAIGLVRGNPLYSQLVERGHDADAFQRKVAAALAERFGQAPNRSALSAIVLTAH
jgi:ubiquinone/menaquinone biosynthesis C-methylase UbiE